MIKKIKQKLAGKEEASILELFNISYDDEFDLFFDSRNEIYFDLIERKTKDINNISIYEEESDVLFEALLHKKIKKQKLIFLNFQNTAMEQINYHKRLLEKTEDKVRIEWIQKSITELETIEETTNKMGFYYMLFASSKSELEDDRKIYENTLGTGIHGLMSYISKEDKIKILEKIFNIHEKSSL